MRALQREFGGHFATAPIGLAAVAGVVALGGYRWFSGAPAVVFPPDGEQIDAVVLELIDEHIRLVQASPRSAEAHGRLGAVYAANGLHAQAERSFANAARLAPEAGVWPFHQALAMEQIGKMEAATELLRKTARAHPDYSALQQRLGESLLESGDLDGAARAFENVIASAPEKPQGHTGLADVCLRRRDFSGAERTLEKALAVEPTNRSARYLLGLALRGQGKTEAARRELARGVGAKRQLLRDELSDSLERFTVNLAGRLDLARQYKAVGNLPAAARLLEAALVRRSDNCELLNNLASVYVRQLRLEEAIEVLEYVIARDPESRAAYYNVGMCYKGLARLEEAVRSFGKSVELAPNHPSGHYQLIGLYRRLGDVESADRHRELFARFNSTVDESEKTTEALERGRYSQILVAPRLTAEIEPRLGRVRSLSCRTRRRARRRLRGVEPRRRCTRGRRSRRRGRLSTEPLRTGTDRRLLPA